MKNVIFVCSTIFTTTTCCTSLVSASINQILLLPGFVFLYVYIDIFIKTREKKTKPDFLTKWRGKKNGTENPLNLWWHSSYFSFIATPRYITKLPRNTYASISISFSVWILMNSEIKKKEQFNSENWSNRWLLITVATNKLLCGHFFFELCSFSNGQCTTLFSFVEQTECKHTIIKKNYLNHLNGYHIWWTHHFFNDDK